MVNTIQEKIKLKEREILDFIQEQKEYGSFDIEKSEELKSELHSLHEELNHSQRDILHQENQIQTPECKRCNVKMVIRKASK